MLKPNQLPLAGVSSSTITERAQVKSCFRPMQLGGIKRIILQLLFVGCSFVSLSLAQTLPNHPNVVIILADDLGYGDVSFNGCPDYLTPNIDSLATNGVRFPSGYVTHPFCSPSRAALLTGRYQQRFGHENQPEQDDNNTILGLPTGELVLPQMLKPAGYVCGTIGKWHLGTAQNLRPNQRGFDEFFGFLTGESPYNPPVPVFRNNTSVTESAYLTDAFTREAVSFINRHATQPFFLFLSYSAPHSPYQATQSYLNRVSNISDPARQTYAAMIIAMDDGIGQVLQTLQTHNLLNNTLIFFLSDNGAVSADFTRNDPLRGAKFDVLEGGIRVPFVVQWTGRLPTNCVYDQPVSALDIVPTVASVAGVSLPTDRPYDGLNILPYLISQQAIPSRTLFWRWFGLGANGPWGSLDTIYAARSGSLKLVRYRALTGGPQLYNLDTDIGETRDLSLSSPGNVDSLQRAYDQWNTQLIPPLWQQPNNFRSNPIVLAGDWNAFNKNDSSSPWALTRITGPNVQGTPDGYDWFINTIHVASVGGDTIPGTHSFAFVGNQSYSNQWGGVAIKIDDITSVPPFSGTALGPTNSISFNEGFYYSFRIIDQIQVGDASLRVAVMKTSAPPISVSVSGQTPMAPTSNDPVVISISTSQPKSVEEHIYLRWSTDSFITSHMVQAVLQGAGVNYTATIPVQQVGTAVQYCLTTSTVDLSQASTSGIIDTLTLSSSSNSHYVAALGATPTATPTPTPTATPTPTPTPASTPAVTALTYNGQPFTNGTQLTTGTTYTFVAEVNAATNKVEFKRDGQVVLTANPPAPYKYIWTPNAPGGHTFAVTPISSGNVRGNPVTINFSVGSANPTPTPTPTPTSTPTPTATPTPTPTQTPALSGLTYNGGIAFVDGTTLIFGQRYTITTEANTLTQSAVFGRDGAVVKTDSASPFDVTWIPTKRGTHTFVISPCRSSGGTGSSGTPITASFKVVKASPTPTPMP